MAKHRPLTEEEWLASRSPYEMLYHLQQHQRISKVPGGRRRLRLFGVACCRSIWEHLDDDRSRQAVEVSERFADGRARKAELAAAHEKAVEAHRPAGQALAEIRARGESAPEELVARNSAAAAAAWVAGARLTGGAFTTAVHVVASSTANVRYWQPVGGPPAPDLHVATDPTASARAELVPEGFDSTRARKLAHQKELSFQAGLVRCLFGNPFRPAAADGEWAGWNGGTVAKMARAIYGGRDFERLPILADALEEAGCAERAVLGHCRSGGPHARGCWVVDALLGTK
jgi:hypothetical protein